LGGIQLWDEDEESDRSRSLTANSIINGLADHKPDERFGKCNDFKRDSNTFDG